MGTYISSFANPLATPLVTIEKPQILVHSSNDEKIMKRLEEMEIKSPNDLAREAALRYLEQEKAIQYDIAALEGIAYSLVFQAFKGGILIPGFRTLEKGMNELRRHDSKAFHDLPYLVTLEDIKDIKMADLITRSIYGRTQNLNFYPVGYALELTYDDSMKIFHLNIYNLYCDKQSVARKIIKFIALHLTCIKNNEERIQIIREKLAAGVFVAGDNVARTAIANMEKKVRKMKLDCLESFIIKGNLPASNSKQSRINDDPVVQLLGLSDLPQEYLDSIDSL